MKKHIKMSEVVSVSGMGNETLRNFLKNFKARLIPYAETLGITSMELQSIEADYQFIKWLYDTRKMVQQYTRNMDTFSRQFRRLPHYEIPMEIPERIELPTQPVVVPPYLNRRWQKFIQKIVDSKNFTIEIGQEIGIIVP